MRARLLLVTAAATLAVTGCGDDSRDHDVSSGVAQDETFTARGSVRLTSASIERVDGSCFGSDGFDDITAGAQVVVRDARGESVALGELDEGTPAGAVQCVFTFAVRDVPAGDSVYSAEVAGRGEVSFTPDEAFALSLTLG